LKNELQYVISVRLEELANELSKRNSVHGNLVDARLDGDVLSLFLKPLDRDTGESESDAATSVESQTEARTTLISKSSTRRMRGRRRRNRMKTRGWNIVGQVVNKYSQKANVYEPFVEALDNVALSRAEQRSSVSKILRSNGNVPSQDSIDYFLDSTVKYLAEKGGRHE